MKLKNEEEIVEPFQNLFSDEDGLFAYLAGVYESSGYISIQNGNFKISISGNYNFLDRIKDSLVAGGSIISTPYFQLQILSNIARDFLVNIYPYLISKRYQAELVIEFQNHINSRRGKRIDENEQIYRNNAIEKIKNTNFSGEIDLEHVDKWISTYFLGFFGFNAKINLKKKGEEFWLNIRLTSEFDYILDMFQQIYDLGYVYNARSTSRWELNYSDAYDLLVEIYPHLIEKKEESEIAIRFHNYLQEAKKPLTFKDINYLNNLIEESKNLIISPKKIPTNNFSMNLAVCDELLELIDKFIQESKNHNRSSLIKDAIKFFKNNKSKVLNAESPCKNRYKDRQIPLQLDNNDKDDISITGNRSELLRKIIFEYLNEHYHSK